MLVPLKQTRGRVFSEGRGSRKPPHNQSGWKANPASHPGLQDLSHPQMQPPALRTPAQQCVTPRPPTLTPTELRPSRATSSPNPGTSRPTRACAHLPAVGCVEPSGTAPSGHQGNYPDMPSTLFIIIESLVLPPCRAKDREKDRDPRFSLLSQAKGVPICLKKTY